MSDKEKSTKLTLKLDVSKKQKLEELLKKRLELTSNEGKALVPKEEDKSAAQVKEKASKSVAKVGGKEDEVKKKEPKELVKNDTPEEVDKVSEEKKHHIIAQGDYKAILKYLQKNYPKCFNIKRIKPLEVGIRKKLIAIEEKPFSNFKLRKFLKAYTSTERYKKSLRVGASRVSLTGEKTSKVLKEEVKKVDPKKK